MQRRIDGSVDFQRTWGAYRRGFGSLLAEHWLGLDKMSRLTMQDSYELRIDLIDFNGTRAAAEYERVWINDFWSNFRLQLGASKWTAQRVMNDFFLVWSKLQSNHCRNWRMEPVFLGGGGGDRPDLDLWGPWAD